MFKKRSQALVIEVFCILIITMGNVCSQPYPNHMIRIVTAAAGGGSDFVARLISQGIAPSLGQPVVIENRVTGVLAGEAAFRAPPDGYTLTVQGGAFWIGPLLRKTTYDPIKDFTAISLIVREVNILAINPLLPVQTVKDLIAYAKANPKKLNYSSPGIGSTTNLASELFNSMAGVNIIHVPYQGNQPAISAMMGGEVQLAIFDAGLILPHVKSGRLRALAVTSSEPSMLAPGLPTIASSGLPGYESIGLTGIFAVGHKISKTIVNKINEEILKFIAKSGVKEQLLNSGVEMVGSTPEQFENAIQVDISKMSKLIKDIGLHVE